MINVLKSTSLAIFVLLMSISQSVQSVTLSLEGTLSNGIFFDTAEGSYTNYRTQEYLGNNLNGDHEIFLIFDLSGLREPYQGPDLYESFYGSIVLSNSSNDDYITRECFDFGCADNWMSNTVSNGVSGSSRRFSVFNSFGSDSEGVIYDPVSSTLSLSLTLDGLEGDDYYLVFDALSDIGRAGYSINVTDNASPVPLPASVWLFMSGLLVLFQRRLVRK